MTDTQINVGMNVDGVVTGTEKAKRSVRGLADTAKEAQTSVGGIGDGGANSAQKVEAATRSMVGSLQRQIAATEAGDKSTRKYQESLARLRGVDVNTLKPLLDQLDSAKNKAESAARASDSLSSSLTNIKVASAAVAAAGAAFVAYAKHINDGVDALNDLKDATGASIENISALEDIALRTGTSFDTVGAALIKLNQSLGASKPGSDTEKALKAIGLSVSELKALDPAEAFQKIAVSLSGFADDSYKARLTQELFGKSLKEIAPLLNDVASAGGLVAKVTAQQAEEAEKFNKEIFSLQANVQSFSRILISDLVTGINAATKAWRDYGAVAGVQTLFFGDDQFKNDKTLVEQTDKLLGLERDIQNLKQSGTALDAALLRRKQEDLKVLQEQIKTTLAYRKVLAEEASPVVQAKKSVADIGSGPTAAQISAAAAKAKEARAQAIKDELEGFKTMDNARKDYEKSIADGLKAEIAAYNDYAKDLDASQQKTIEGYKKSAESSIQRAQGLQDEETAAALAIASNVSLAVAVEQVALSRLREVQAQQLAAGADGATLLALQQEIESRERIIKLITSKDGRDAASDAAKKAADEWKKASDQISQSLTNAIFAGFENGKGFAENFRSVLESTFKTMILRPTVEAVVKGGTNFATSAVGSFTEGIGAGSLSSLLGGGSVLATGSNLAGAFSAGFGGGPGVGAFLAEGGSTAAAGAASTGAFAAAALPYVAAAVALYALSGGFKGEYVKGAGSANVAIDSAGNVTSKNQFSAEFDFQTQAADAIVDGIKKSYLTAAKQLGITDLAASFGFGSNNSDGGKFGITAVSGGASRFNVTDVKTSDAALSLEASRAVFAALQGSNLPAYLVKVFDGITASTATEAQIQSTLQFASGLKTLRESLLETREPLQILQDSVATGFADLGTNATTFKTDFVSAIDAGIGPDALAKWVNLGDSIKALDKEIASAANTTTDAQKAIAKVSQDLQAEGTSLQAQWDKIFLSAEQQRTKEIAGYTALQVAQYDTNKAIEASITAYNTQADAIASITEGLQSDGASLQDQWDQIFLNAEQYRAKAITGLTDLQVAQYDTNRAIEASITAYEKQKAVVAERTGLESQLLQLQGNTNALRQRELDALDPSNRALQQQIFALEDQAAAAAKAKTSQDDYNRSLENAANNLKAAQSAVTSARNAVESIQGEGTNAYLSALGQVESAQQRIADLQLTAQKDLANAANEAARQMADLGTQLREFVNGAQLKPSDNFSRLLNSALRGDKAAIQALPGAAGTAIDAAKGNATSGLEFARAQARIVAQVASVATLAELAGKNTVEVPAGTDPLVKAQQELATAQTALSEALRVANAINAPLTASVSDLIGKFAAAQVDLAKSIADAGAAQAALNAISKNTKDTAEATAKFKIYIDESLNGTIAVIDFIQGSALPDDLKALALSGPRTVKTTIDFIKGADLPLDLKTLALDVGGTINKTFSFLTGAVLADDLKAIALQVSGDVVKTYDYLVRTDQLTPDLKKIALSATGEVTKTIDFVAGAKLPDDLYKLALGTLGAVDKTINFVAGSQLPDDLKALAFKTTEPITKTVNFVAGSQLSDDLKTIALGGTNDYTANVNAVLASNVSPELKKLVIDGVGEYSATVNAVTAATMPDSLKKVLFTGLGDYTANIGAIYSSALTTEQKALLTNANTTANRAITLGAVFASNLTADQSAALKVIDGEQIRRTIAASVTTGVLTTAQYNVLNAGNGDVVERTIKALVNDTSLTTAQRSLLTAITDGTSGNLNLGGTVTFDPSQALINIFNEIKEGNRLLLEATKLNLKVLFGTEFSSQLLPTAPFNSLGDGTYKLQIDMLAELRALKTRLDAISTNTGTTATESGKSATVLDRVTQGGTRLRTVESAA